MAIAERITGAVDSEEDLYSAATAPRTAPEVAKPTQSPSQQQTESGKARVKPLPSSFAQDIQALIQSQAELDQHWLQANSPTASCTVEISFHPGDKPGQSADMSSPSPQKPADKSPPQPEAIYGSPQAATAGNEAPQLSLSDPNLPAASGNPSDKAERQKPSPEHGAWPIDQRLLQKQPGTRAQRKSQRRRQARGGKTCTGLAEGEVKQIPPLAAEAPPKAQAKGKKRGKKGKCSHKAKQAVDNSELVALENGQTQEPATDRNFKRQEEPLQDLACPAIDPQPCTSPAEAPAELIDEAQTPEMNGRTITHQVREPPSRRTRSRNQEVLLALPQPRRRLCKVKGKARDLPETAHWQKGPSSQAAAVEPQKEDVLKAAGKRVKKCRETRELRNLDPAQRRESSAEEECNEGTPAQEAQHGKQHLSQAAGSSQDREAYNGAGQEEALPLWVAASQQLPPGTESDYASMSSGTEAGSQHAEPPPEACGEADSLAIFKQNAGKDELTQARAFLHGDEGNQPKVKQKGAKGTRSRPTCSFGSLSRVKR